MTVTHINHSIAQDKTGSIRQPGSWTDIDAVEEGHGMGGLFDNLYPFRPIGNGPSAECEMTYD
jgi:hypothetical protein